MDNNELQLDLVNKSSLATHGLLINDMDFIAMRFTA